MSLQSISPERARELVEGQGALLVDIREPDEYARERISGARDEPLASIRGSAMWGSPAPCVIFYCKSGMRTAANASRLAAAAGCPAYMIEGGLEAWKRARLPVLEDRRQPLEIMRQVQIVAGGMVVLGVVLGATVQPAFYSLAALIGAGLVFAGATGSCALAGLLRLMPWNRPVK